MEYIKAHFNKTQNKSLIKITKFSKIIANPRFMLGLIILLLITTCIMYSYLISFCLKSSRPSIILVSIISFFSYLIVFLFSIREAIKLNRTIKYLKDAHLHNKNIITLNEKLRIIKHDFSNIIQCMGGYILNDDMTGLKKYYKSISKEFGDINNLSAINSNFITDSALYNLISLKYSSAEEQGISFNINIGVKLDKMQISSYTLTRILGILLDNAIDAAKKCDIKEIYFEVSPSYEKGKIKKHTISVQNTYTNKDVDVDKIREKGYTSKTHEKGSHGLGLWEVNKILKKSKNLNLHTTKNDEFFIQELEIYNIQRK